MYVGFVLGSVLAICVGSLAVALYLTRWVLSQPEGPRGFTNIADAIREGSEAFFSRVYGTIARLALPMGGVLFCLYYFRQPSKDTENLDQMMLAILTALSFLAGAFCSGLAGYIGLWTSVRANVRVAYAATISYRGTIQVALRGGAVAALFVVTLVVLGVTLLFCLFDEIYTGREGLPLHKVPLLLVGYGFGASFVALFAQLGGGIFTKAADVGADLVGKVEQDIPEDDPRNPAVIADLVGDNVGDCSARGADLFESIAAEIISAMILGGTLSNECNMSETEMKGYIFFPLLVHAFDLVVSTLGVFSVSGKDSGGARDDPLKVLKVGYKTSMGFAVAGFLVATRWLLYAESAPSAWWHFFLCGLVGMCSAYASVIVTQYYTDYIYRPVISIAEASTTGHATNVIAGIAVGFESTMIPVLVISASILSAYWLGRSSGLTDAEGNPNGGPWYRRRHHGHAFHCCVRACYGRIWSYCRQRWWHRRNERRLRRARQRYHRSARLCRQHDKSGDQGIRYWQRRARLLSPL